MKSYESHHNYVYELDIFAVLLTGTFARIIHILGTEPLRMPKRRNLIPS